MPPAGSVFPPVPEDFLEAEAGAADAPPMPRIVSGFAPLPAGVFAAGAADFAPGW
jgi:hypothetical protein